MHTAHIHSYFKWYCKNTNRADEETRRAVPAQTDQSEQTGLFVKGALKRQAQSGTITWSQQEWGDVQGGENKIKTKYSIYTL